MQGHFKTCAAATKQQPADIDAQRDAACKQRAAAEKVAAAQRTAARKEQAAAEKVAAAQRAAALQQQAAAVKKARLAVAFEAEEAKKASRRSVLLEHQADEAAQLAWAVEKLAAGKKHALAQKRLAADKAAQNAIALEMAAASRNATSCKQRGKRTRALEAATRSRNASDTERQGSDTVRKAAGQEEQRVSIQARAAVERAPSEEETLRRIFGAWMEMKMVAKLQRKAAFETNLTAILLQKLASVAQASLPPYTLNRQTFRRVASP